MSLAPGLVLAAATTIAQPAVTASTCPPPDERPMVAAVPIASIQLAGCVVADLEAGRWDAADGRLRSAALASVFVTSAPARRQWQALVARLAARRAVDIGDWTSSVDDVLPFEDAAPWAGPLVRGLSAARALWARQDAALLDRARRELARLESLARDAGPVSDAEHARLVVQGAIAGAQYERDELQLVCEAAHELEARLVEGGAVVPVVLAREVEADLLRVTDRYAAAAALYRQVLDAVPRRVQSRLGLAQAYRRLGYEREAALTVEQARSLWRDADPAARARLR